MEQSLESYLKSMEMKTKVFGGYDPEDVILKMTEVARLARSEAGGDQLDAYRAQAEAACREHSEEKQARQQLERVLSDQTEKLRQAEAALAEASARNRQLEEEKRRTEAELEQLRALYATRPEPPIYAPPAQELIFSRDSDAEKLHILVPSIEDAKEDILRRCKGQTIKDAERIRAESALMEQKNRQLRKLLEEDAQTMTLALDALLAQAQQMRMQLTRLQTRDNGHTET